ncbi:four and a half LIM domains protein 2-like [Uloborus diversus]|uniref:four and a half LIM domains protein 2-like n=1 Tax=Uloborus diversus TaxID=327109 RepID=UPI00240A5CC7|nr:four and a half LIM domains protein 2-like [Uloborus diversus]
MTSVAVRGRGCTHTKVCKNCNVPHQNHSIVEENLFSIQNSLGISAEFKCPCRTKTKEPHKIYAWTPPGLSPEKVEEYFAQLPNHKVPRWKSTGETYREKQLQFQLPKQDLASAYCQNLHRDHLKAFEDFVNMRNEMALDIAYVREFLDRQNECGNCGGTMQKGDVAVIAPKFGESVAWHPACFVCSTCDELLVDLTHCVRDGKLYCERHFAEKIKPRCSGCDELIFSGEYTRGMSRDWHSGHFSCWQCDETLSGRRYVLRDDHPYCIDCYERLFSNTCDECGKLIGIDSKDLSYKERHWHESCFICNKCRSSLIDKPFGSKSEKIYCANCYDAAFASRCDGCNQVFRAGTKKMEYKGHQWHENCFTCSVCLTPIGTRSFIPRDDDIYCITCFEEKFATRCTKCRRIINGGGVTYRNEPWHRECFTCSHCAISLAGQRFTSRDEKPYCADCFGILFAKKCTACNKPITGIGGTRFISFEDRNWHNDCFMCAECCSSLVGKGFLTDGPDILCPDCAKRRLI